MRTPQHLNSYLLHQEEEAIEDEEDEKEITQREAICWLFILTIWISVLSGYLVDAIQVLKSLQTVMFIRTSFCPFSSIAYSYWLLQHVVTGRIRIIKLASSLY